MSSLISSFFIEPVVRQARRFSNVNQQDAATNPIRESQSHASNATPIVQTTAQLQQQQQQAITDAQRGSNLGQAIFDRFVPLVAARGPLPPPVLPIPSISSPQSLQHETDLDVQQHQRLTTQNAAVSPATTTHPLAISSHVNNDDEEALVTDENMPSPTSNRLREGNRTPPSPRLSRNGTLRRVAARDVPRPGVGSRQDTTASMSSSLPADDGMKLLRSRIHQIRELSESQDEKARRMHDLMTAEWHAAQASIRPQSPASMTSQDRIFLPSSPLSAAITPASPLSTSSIPADLQNPYNLQAEDFMPSYRPISAVGSSNDTTPEEDLTPPAPVLGCKHYKRNVKIQCHDCKHWYTCRHCHDTDQPSHNLNRRATENMLCMMCFTPQAAAQWCKGCGERGAWYYCDICKLWDDDSTKSIYHCQDCGICRRGEGIGKDFVHCKKCNVCISISHYQTHTCIENATDSNCPLCLDYMFTSPHEIVAMPCGHYLHHHCYSQLMLSSYQCPICKRSAVNMETAWRKLDEEIKRQPMPREFADTRMEIKCNDCASRSVVAFHWLGCRCSKCDGFNTLEVKLIADQDVQRDVEDFASQRRERREVEQRNRQFDLPVRRPVFRPMRIRPYFSEMEDENLERPGSARSGDSGFSMPTLPQLPNLNPYEMLARVSRGLSPIRHYFDGDQLVEGAALPARIHGSAEEGEWVDEGDWFLTSDEDGSSDDDSDEEHFSDEEDGGLEEGELDLDLFGHR